MGGSCRERRTTARGTYPFSAGYRGANSEANRRNRTRVSQSDGQASSAVQPSPVTTDPSPSRLKTVCFFDGACPGNQFAQKGPMKAAFVIGDQEFVRDVRDLQTRDGPMRSNNIAEYHGLIFLLRHLRDLDRERGSKGAYLICGDSELVIRQMRGADRVRTSHLLPLHEEALRLSSGLDVEFREVPRKQNRAGRLLE